MGGRSSRRPGRDNMSETMNGAGTELPVAADSGNVDKIRDILFGAQMRDYDRRFATLEERLLRESGELREDLQRRVTATEQFLRGELEALAQSLSAEQRERKQGVRDAMDATANLNRELSDRVATLAEQVAQQHRELRNTMNDHVRQLGEELERRHQEMTGELRRESYELRSAKADRAALAAMFAEFAQRLAADGDPR
jgi:type I site-specific restriction endonuclease